MRPFSQKQPFAARDLMIQGQSVRQTWGIEDEPSSEEQPSIRRDFKPRRATAPAPQSEDQLRLRLGEELDYARRMLDAMADVISADPIALSRHGLSLQAIDKVGQMITHIANVIRSSDPDSAVDQVCMGDLRARLQRSRAL